VIDSTSVSRREELRNSVAVGEDGFLFQRFNCAFEQLCGEFTLNSEQLDRWVSLVESRHAWCSSRGIRYLFLAVPEKHVIYPDKLPGGAIISQGRPIRQISEALAGNVRGNFVYPDTALRAGRAVMDTYYRTDVHWTWYGAYLGYKELLTNLDSELLPISLEAVEQTQFRMVGDLGVRLDPPSYEVGVRIKHPAENRFHRVFSNNAYGRGQVEVFEGDDRALPKAIIFRDSNATAMIPFLGGHFSRLILVSATQLFHQLIRSEQPDFVITQMTERYIAQSDQDGLINFPDEFGAVGYGASTQTTLPLPRGSSDFLIDFSMRGNSANYRRDGWRGQEPDHVWAIGPSSSIVVPGLDQHADYEMQLEVSAFVAPPAVASQQLEIVASGTVIGSFEVVRHAVLRCRIPKEVVQQETEFVFNHPSCESPKDLGVGPDNSLLAICFNSVRFRLALSTEV
jgi:alginate O-acetyltransferase complex protein AlgJ